MNARKGENPRPAGVEEGESPDGETSPVSLSWKVARATPAYRPLRLHLPRARRIRAAFSDVRLARRQRGSKKRKLVAESAGDGSLRASTMRFVQKRRGGFAGDVRHNVRRTHQVPYHSCLLAEGVRAERWRIARPEYRAIESISASVTRDIVCVPIGVGPAMKTMKRATLDSISRRDAV